MQLAVDRCDIGVGIRHLATGQIKGSRTIENKIKVISVLRNMRNLSELSWFLPSPAASEFQSIDDFLAQNDRRFRFFYFRVDVGKRQQ